MKHRILFSLFCLGLVACMVSCGDGFDITPPDTDQIPQGDGKLKAIWTGFNNFDPYRQVALYEYDSEGRISKVSSFPPLYYADSGVSSGYDSYKYDDAGHLSLIETYSKDERDNFYLYQSQEFAYNGNGEVSRKIVRQPSSDYYPQTTLYLYNKYNQLSEEKQYDQNEKLAFKTTYNYNDAGQVTLEKMYTAKGELVTVTEHVYEKGLNVQTTQYSDAKKSLILRQVVRTYDKKNNLTKEVTTINVVSSYSGTTYLLYEYF